MVRWRLSTLAVCCAVVVGLSAAPVAAREQERDRGDDQATYLALGDSVAFGTNPLLDANNQANFVGYPEALARKLELRLTNASCPGEASGGFISLSGTDNLCRPYRANFPLHVSYKSSQLDFAVAFLLSHPDTRLVTLNVGANDFFALQKQCSFDPVCVSNGFSGMVSTLAANLQTIYGRLRGEAHYRHRLVGLTYYALNYTDPVGVGLDLAVNQVIATTTLAAGGRVADGFGKWQTVAMKSGGDSCAAGLLIVLPNTNPRVCDDHPAPLGRDLLADAIADALRSGGDD